MEQRWLEEWSERASRRRDGWGLFHCANHSKTRQLTPAPPHQMPNTQQVERTPCESSTKKVLSILIIDPPTLWEGDWRHLFTVMRDVGL